MAKETFYFSHDYNARVDDKIKKLLRKHGIKGYGIWWAIVEDLYNNANALRTDYDGIAYDLREDATLVKSVINDFDLFVVDGDFFGSESVERRMNERNEKSKKARVSASYRWGKQKNNANASQEDANASKTDAIKESKVKESKESNYKKTLLSEITISEFPTLNSDYVEIAKAFVGLFKKNLIEAGASTLNVDRVKGSCIDDIRLIIEVNKYTMNDLREVYRFLQVNEFWKKNILSTGKLREKMDKLKMELKNGTDKRNSKEGTSWSELANIVAGQFATN